jgi:hypothetical protein
MAWYLNKALTNFREEVNRSFPNRDKGSDGTIGDKAHQATNSDHNPDKDGSVDAWDMDVEVNGRGKSYGSDVEKIKRTFEAHEASHYWIHNDRIAFRSEGWKPRSYAYAGPNRNRHDKHVHFNTRPSHENSTKPWGVKEAVEEDVSAEDVFNFKIYNPVTKTEVAFKTYVQSINREVYEQGQSLDKQGEQIASLAETVDKLVSTPPGTVVITDEQLERVLRKVLGSVDNEQ